VNPSSNLPSFSSQALVEYVFSIGVFQWARRLRLQLEFGAHKRCNGTGNRTSMTIWNNQSVNKTTTYTYGNRGCSCHRRRDWRL